MKEIQLFVYALVPGYLESEWASENATFHVKDDDNYMYVY